MNFSNIKSSPSYSTFYDPSQQSKLKTNYPSITNPKEHVNWFYKSTQPEVPLYQEDHKYYKNYGDMIMKNLFEDTDLARLFFSNENMNRIQKKIKKTILEKTRGQYKMEDDQDSADLLVSMRYIFMQYGNYLPNKLVHQVKILNQQVVEYVVPDMITGIKQYYGYLKDINTPIKPIARPVNVSHAGRRTLPSITTIWSM